MSDVVRMRFEGVVAGVKASRDVDRLIMRVRDVDSPMSMAAIAVQVPRSPGNVGLYRRPLTLEIAIDRDGEEPRI